MIKARSLTRVFHEQTKFLYNQEKPLAWHCRILRAAAPAGSEFAIEFPEWNDQAFLIRAKDLGKHRLVRLFRDSFPMFADKTVDYPGQPLALLVVPEQDQLQKLEQDVKISYFPAQASPSPAALAEGEPVPAYYQRQVSLGDAAGILPQCPKIVESHFDLAGYNKLHFEPRGAIAEWKSEMLWVQCSTSWPQLVRRLISESTGLPQKNITVISQPSAWLPDRFIVDSSFLACYAAMAALTCMKQVQLFLTASEDIHYGTRQGNLQAQISSGHTPDGKLVALKANIELDLGSWPLASQESAQFILAGLSSTYRCPNQDLSVRITRSPQAPLFLQSMYGLAASQLAMEQHVRRICLNLDLDEVHWRSQNLAAKADQTPYGHIADHSAGAHQALLEAAKASDYHRVWATNELLRKLRNAPEIPLSGIEAKRLQGIGLAVGYQSHGLLVSTELSIRPRVKLTLNQDGHLEVASPMHATNSALKDAWSSGLEEITGIDSRNISFTRFSTDQLDDSGPARFSRITSLYSPLIAAAGKTLRQKLDRQTTLPIEIKLSLPNLRRLAWDEENFSGTPFLARSWACATVQLRVDPVSLLPEIKEVWLCVSAGAILHPERAESILRQQISDSLAWLSHGASQRQGVQPRVFIKFLHQDRYESQEQRLTHAGGIGELCGATIPAAFANALAQALGQPVSRLPCGSQEVFDLMHGPEIPAPAAPGVGETSQVAL